jgi:hypothetical protein
MIIKDPYSEMIMEMRKHGSYNNPPNVEIGEVTNINPLAIKVGDLPLTKDNLYVADYLLDNYQREISIPQTTATGIATSGSYNATITAVGIPDVEVTYKTCLNKNDSVALIQISSTKYIILCKVVSVS